MVVRCPDCGGEDTLVEVSTEATRVTTRLSAVETTGGQWVTVEVDEGESEVLGRDHETLRCEDCGHETDDDADFLHDPNQDEEEV